MEYQYEKNQSTPTFERVLVVDGLVRGFGDDGVAIESEYDLYDFQTYDGLAKYKVIDGVAVLRSEEELEAYRAERPAPPPTTDERIATLEEHIAQADETAIDLYEAQEAQEAINAQQDEALMEIYEMIG